jgi:NADH dehydrogenase (ubiquinone) flavoprotein 2
MLRYISQLSASATRTTPRAFRRGAPYSIILVHRDTSFDSQASSFEFDKANLDRAKEVIAKYPAQYKKAAVMPLLDLGQRQLGFTSIAVMNYVAKLLDMPPMRVYEVATFYTMYNRKPVGKYNIQVCTTTPCQLCGSDNVMKAVEETLGVKPGQTTEDKLFTFLEVECLGACVNAPMLAVNDDYHEDLTAENTVKLLTDLRNGKDVKPGPYSGRESCEPFLGPKVLLGKEPTDLRKFTRLDL